MLIGAGSMRTLAMSIRSPSNDDIYLLDVASGRFDRFSFDIAEDESPVWSPDGRRIAYSSASVGDQRRIFEKTIGSVEPERLLYTGKRHLHLTSWSPDGRWLAFYEYNPRSIDAWALDVNDTTKLVPVATTPANDENPVFSPDGRWLAYASNETGRYETYVVSFPDLRAKQQVSRDGGYFPQWSRTGEVLFFFDRFLLSSGSVMSAGRVTAGSAIAWQQPMRRFEVSRVNDLVIGHDTRSLYFLAPNPDGPARDQRGRQLGAGSAQRRAESRRTTIAVRRVRKDPAYVRIRICGLLRVSVARDRSPAEVGHYVLSRTGPAKAGHYVRRTNDSLVVRRRGSRQLRGVWRSEGTVS